MGAVAVFSYSAWVARYPEFAAVPEATAEAYFSEATLYLSNDGGSPVPDTKAAVQLMLLNMLTAHLAQLNWTPSGAQPSQIVGRIASATEGSVSVSADLTIQAGSAAWFTQTKYGLAFWQATAAYRTARYRPGPPNRAAVVGVVPGIFNQSR